MKRIDFIVKGVKGIIKDTFEFREKRIKRTLDEMIDNAEEMAFESKTKAVEAINSIKDVADNKECITRKFNEYISFMEDHEGYLRSKKYLEDAKALLDEDIDVEVEEK